MKTNDQPIRDRVVEELSKLGDNNPDVARKLGVTCEAVRWWRDGLTVPKAHNLAKFHAAGLDIFYIITGRHIGDIVAKACYNCHHFNMCDVFDCDDLCETCPRNSCRDCHNYSGWLWEGYSNK